MLGVSPKQKQKTQKKTRKAKQKTAQAEGKKRKNCICPPHLLVPLVVQDQFVVEFLCLLELGELLMGELPVLRLNMRYLEQAGEAEVGMRYAER